MTKTPPVLVVELGQLLLTEKMKHFYFDLNQHIFFVLIYLYMYIYMTQNKVNLSDGVYS